MGGGITIGGVVSRSARLAGRYWRTLLPAAAGGMALKRVSVWALFDSNRFLVRILPLGSAVTLLRDAVDQFFNVVAGAFLIWLVLASIRGKAASWREAGGAIASVLPALALLSLIHVAAWKPGVFLTQGMVMSRLGPYGVMIGLGAFAWSVAYIALAIRWWLATPIILAGRLWLPLALSRSWSLTRGSAMRIFAIDTAIALCTRLPVVAFLMLGGARLLLPANSPWTTYGGAMLVLDVFKAVASAACIAVVYAALAGVEDDRVLDTFS